MVMKRTFWIMSNLADTKHGESGCSAPIALAAQKEQLLRSRRISWQAQGISGAERTPLSAAPLFDW